MRQMGFFENMAHALLLLEPHLQKKIQSTSEIGGPVAIGEIQEGALQDDCFHQSSHPSQTDSGSCFRGVIGKAGQWSMCLN